MWRCKLDSPRYQIVCTERNEHTHTHTCARAHRPLGLIPGPLPRLQVLAPSTYPDLISYPSHPPQLCLPRYLGLTRDTWTGNNADCEDDDDCSNEEICCPDKKKCEVPLEGTNPAACGKTWLTLCWEAGVIRRRYERMPISSPWVLPPCVGRDKTTWVPAFRDMVAGGQSCDSSVR